jgi:xylose dehydrogenase (NAD/NADP)
MPAILRAKNAELVGISSNKDKVRNIAETFSIPKVYDHYEELLQDPEIDAVYIPLPNHLHKEWVLKAAQYGKHVVCEKPAALTTAEAEEMVTYCEEKNVKFMEGFMYQFHPQHERVREIIASGEIGEVKLIQSTHTYYLANRETNIRMDKSKGGGSLYDVGSYSIHAIRHILQIEPVEVFAQADIDPETGIDLTTRAFLKLANGGNSMVVSSFDMTRCNEYDVIGTKGYIKVPFAFRPDMLNGGLGLISVTMGLVTREEKIEGDLFLPQVEHFSDVVLKDQQPIQIGENTIQNMRIIDACYESIRSGKTITI